MNYKFVLVDAADEDNVREWVLPTPVTVGRCPTVDISIDDASISRRHCKFFVNPHGSLVVRDLGSKNGVFIDGKKVEKAVVVPGASVRIGLVVFRAELTDEEPTPRINPATAFQQDETKAVKIVNPDDVTPDGRYEIG